MTIHQLRIFQSIVKHLSVTKAASEIHISQPSISKQLRLLEEEYGVKFHERTGHGIKLTREGQAFWAAIQPVLLQIEDTKKMFLRSAEKNYRFLAIGASQSPSSSLLPDALKIFHTTYPNVQTLIRRGESRLVEQMLLDREIDIGLITNPSHNPKIVFEPLRRAEIIAVVSAKHPLARKRSLTEKELTTTPVLIRVGGKIVDQLEKMGVKLTIAMRYDSSEGIKAAVESGLGMGFFYRDTVDLGLRQGYLKSIYIQCLKSIEIRCFIISRTGAVLSTNATDFLQVLRSPA